MNDFFQHPAVFAIGAYWVFSAFVGGMPAPSEKSSPAYTWMHDSLHILAGNMTTAFQSRLAVFNKGVVNVDASPKA